MTETKHIVTINEKEYNIIFDRQRQTPKITRLVRLGEHDPLPGLPEGMDPDTTVFYAQFVIDETEEMEVVLALGSKFAAGSIWKREFDWAWKRHQKKGSSPRPLFA